MTPNPASAGSNRLDVAAKPPEPIQNWLLIFARGLARPTGTSARTPKFTTPSNPFAPNGLSSMFRCRKPLPGFYQDGFRSSPRYPFTPLPSVVHCPGFVGGRMATAPAARPPASVDPEGGGSKFRGQFGRESECLFD